MLDLVQVKTFIVVAATKNFRRAAAQLGYSQSTVTYHIKTLERELGVRLLSRFQFARKITLTAVGRRILKYATQLVLLADETKAAAQRKVTKTRTAETLPLAYLPSVARGPKN